MTSTIWQDNAATFAQADRGERADQLLTAAVRDAIGSYRGMRRFARAGFCADDNLSEAVEIILLAAARRAERILPSGTVGVVRVFEHLGRAS